LCFVEISSFFQNVKFSGGNDPKRQIFDRILKGHEICRCVLHWFWLLVSWHPLLLLLRHQQVVIPLIPTNIEIAAIFKPNNISQDQLLNLIARV
jgi:hypothetical protein